METIRSCRIKLGLSQQEFAEYLMIERSRLSRAENGMSTLPASALMKLASLEKFLEHQPKVPAAGKKEKCLKSVRYCQGREVKAKYDLMIMRLQLERMKKTHAGLHYKYKMLEIETVDAGQGLDSIKNYQKIRMARQLKTCDATAQEHLQVRISILAAELSAIRRYLKKNQDPIREKPTLSNKKTKQNGVLNIADKVSRRL